MPASSSAACAALAPISEVNSVSELRQKVGEHKVGDSVKITFDRNGSTRSADIVLEEMPQEDR